MRIFSGAAILAALICQPLEGLAESSSAELAGLVAPSGQYRHDPNHSSLQFSVLHLGLSNYVAGFTDFELELVLDRANPGASTVSVTVDAQSIRTDYQGDYKATHPDSPFDSWEEDLAMSDKFFNAEKHPKIRFQSTSIQPSEDGTLRIAGDLTLLGQTHPIMLEASVVGSTAQHPFTNKGALGLSVAGTFKRSMFGMNYLLSPPLLGDKVTVRFEGEMLQSP